LLKCVYNELDIFVVLSKMAYSTMKVLSIILFLVLVSEGIVCSQSRSYIKIL